jgi:hypothetical protein
MAAADQAVRALAAGPVVVARGAAVPVLADQVPAQAARAPVGLVDRAAPVRAVADQVPAAQAVQARAADMVAALEQDPVARAGPAVRAPEAVPVADQVRVEDPAARVLAVAAEGAAVPARAAARVLAGVRAERAPAVRALAEPAQGVRVVDLVPARVAVPAAAAVLRPAALVRAAAGVAPVAALVALLEQEARAAVAQAAEAARVEVAVLVVPAAVRRARARGLEVVTAAAPRAADRAVAAGRPEVAQAAAQAQALGAVPAAGPAAPVRVPVVALVRAVDQAGRPLQERDLRVLDPVAQVPVRRPALVDAVGPVRGQAAAAAGPALVLEGVGLGQAATVVPRVPARLQRDRVRERAAPLRTVAIPDRPTAAVVVVGVLRVVWRDPSRMRPARLSAAGHL